MVLERMMSTGKTGACRLCVARRRTRESSLEILQKECTFGNRGLSSYPEETKKARFLEFLVS